MADAAALCAHLPKGCRAKIDRFHGNGRRALGAAIALHRPEAEAVFKRLRNSRWQLFRAGHHKAQAAELLGFTPTCVGVEKSRCGKKHRHCIFVDERADDARIERIRVKHDADTGGCRKAQCSCEAEGVKKWKDAHDAIVGVQEKYLIEL